MQDLSLSQLLKLIPTYVTTVAEMLQQHGYEAYLVGGSVRDVLLGIEPDDYDVATNAYPEEIEAIFPKSIPTGATFGTITVVVEDEQGERHDVQITTYRSEADYVGGRWPSKVEFTRSINEDLSRRDFTINAMALNLQEFDTLQNAESQSADKQIQDLLIDLFGGIKDLHAKLIRAVGDPMQRFGEDGLRPVRACRLAAQLSFEIEQQTFAAMKATNHVMQHISVERFRDELMKLLQKAPKPSVGLKLMRESGILQIFIPELLEGEGVVQPEFHVDDVFEHLLATVDVAEDSIKLAALFHDIGKPRTRSEDEYGVHFYGHDQVGAEMTRELMQRLKFSNAEIEHVVKLVRWHMFYYPSADWRKLKKDDFDWASASAEDIQAHIAQTSHRTTAAGWSDAAIRRLIQNLGGQDAIDDLMKLRVADASANPKSEFNPAEIKVLSQRIAEVRAKEMALKVTDLDITGEDLIRELNIPAGPELGEILKFLLDKVVEDPLLNKKTVLLDLAREKLVRS